MEDESTSEEGGSGLSGEAGALFEAVPTALLVVGQDGRIAYANSALRALFGYDESELEGRPVEVLVPPEVAEGHPELRSAYMHVPYQRTMGGGRNLEGVTKSGRRVAIEIGLNAVELNSVGYVVASVLDVGALRAEQEKTRMALDASASAMIMLSGTNEIVLVNRQAVALFGHQESELLGRPIEVLIPERYRRRHTVYRDSYLAHPAKRKMSAGLLLHGLRADGTEFPLEVGLTPANNHGERMVLATVVDITERLEAEQEIKQQNTHLRRLNDELSQFAYSASHDLKAPLATLSGMLQCLDDDLDEGDIEAARTSSAKANDMAARMARLIEDILGFARSEALESQIASFDLRDVVEALSVELDGVFAHYGVELRNNIPPGLAVDADRRRLTQALENLFTNGAKYSDRRSDERFVAVGAEIGGGEMVITVQDNGIGIPEESHGQVFTMFRQFGNHDEDGTGLGLALVKQHVDHLQGHVTFESGAGGTTFTIRMSVQTQEHNLTVG